MGHFNSLNLNIVTSKFLIVWSIKWWNIQFSITEPEPSLSIQREPWLLPWHQRNTCRGADHGCAYCGSRHKKPCATPTRLFGITTNFYAAIRYVAASSFLNSGEEWCQYGWRQEELLNWYWRWWKCRDWRTNCPARVGLIERPLDIATDRVLHIWLSNNFCLTELTELLGSIQL